MRFSDQNQQHSKIFSQDSVLSNKEAKITFGGTDHTLSEILAIFNNTSHNIPSYQLTNPLNTTQYNQFVSLITDLNNTPIGHNLLNALVDSGKTIYLDYQATLDGNVYGDDTAVPDDNNVLILGGFPNSSYMNSGTRYLYLVHELFHAYQDLVVFPTHTTEETNYYQSNRIELDADLFAAFAIWQRDWFAGLGYNFADYYSIQAYATDSYPSMFTGQPNQTSTSNASYSASFQDLVDGDFSINDYNNLIANFATGANYSGTQSLSATPISAYDSVIDFFLSNFFVNDHDPVNPGLYVPSSDPASGSGDGSSGGYSKYHDSSFINFMQSVWSLQNQGYIFYTSSSTTYYPGFYDMGLYAWIPGESVTGYTYAGVGDFYNYYSQGRNFGDWMFRSY